MVTLILVAPLGWRPKTLQNIEQLEALTQGEAADVIEFQRKFAETPEASRRYFTVEFEGGEVRAVFPKDDALEVHYQYEANRKSGIALVN